MKNGKVQIMKDKYIFREITKEEIPLFFELILQRMKWMDDKGIKQWNVTYYDEVYPIPYYEEARQKGILYVLEKKETKEIVCGAVLKEADERWPDDGVAVYLHNFVTKIGETGVGAYFLQCVEAYAVDKGKDSFRLDSAIDNATLSRYYEEKGFLPVGTCVDGLYKGILREKKLR